MNYIIGYSQEGVKHWIHFDGPTFKYILENQQLGACLFEDEKVLDIIKSLEADESLPIRNFTSEKIMAI